MGGASMQISFVPSSPPPTDYADNITVFGSAYTLYSRSYLCYGYNEVLRRMSAFLAEVRLNITMFSYGIVPHQVCVGCRINIIRLDPNSQSFELCSISCFQTGFFITVSIIIMLSRLESL